MWHIWGRGEMHREFLWANLRKEDYLEDRGVDGRIILKFVLEHCDGRCMDWIDLALDRDRWRAVVNVAMNFRVP